MLTNHTHALAPVDPDHIVVFNGCGTALESLAFGPLNLFY